MKKTLGGVVVYDTNPPRFTHNNLDSSSLSTENQNKHEIPTSWEQDKDNQATYLFFPVFGSFFLTLLSTLSSPFIKKLSVANISPHNGGVIQVGLWGWCVRGINGLSDQCSDIRGFGSDLSSTFNNLPEQLQALNTINEKLKSDYIVATTVMHILAGLSVWSTLCWTLAASGSWRTREVWAYNWTRWAFIGVGYSSIMVLIAWSLDIGMLTRIQFANIKIDDVSVSVKPGAVIFLNMISFLLCFVTFGVRVFWSKYKPRPSWTIKGNSDFHNNRYPHPPNSAALPPNEDSPPAWESLNVSDVNKVIVNSDEKLPIDTDSKNSVDQRGFAV
ncbi:uncharacterized protein L201_006580 [Kwoniella dendrophila CBS 6074]|uniref:Uncharacterized protein n=1 Tax=Kwoniella dendrophila CBS 6074 TaxID=1295534 RepID=A0AAX4K2N7_9TREE